MKLILKNIFTNRNTCYYLWFALPKADTEKYENKILKEADCGLTAESGDFKTLAENVIAMYRKTEE